MFGYNCCVCKKSLPMFGYVKKVSTDEYMCNECYRGLPPITRDNIGVISKAEYDKCVDFWKKRNEYCSLRFQTTDSEGKYFEIDENNKWWRIPVEKESPEIFFFAEVTDFELCEDGISIDKGIGGALAGAAIAGSTGAIVGSAATSSKKTISQLYILISLNNPVLKTVKIMLLDYKCSTSHSDYQSARASGNRIMSMLRNMTTKKSTTDTLPTDQLIELKKLFDSGVITQEEFTAKKKKMLGI